MASLDDLEARILVFAPTGRDANLTRELLARSGVECVVCRDVIEVCRRVEEEGAGALLLAEEGLSTAALERVNTLLTTQPPWSDLPVIVFTERREEMASSPRASRLLSALGNVQLLDRPVRPITMLSAVQAALRARRRQYTARAEVQAQQRAVRQRDEFLAMLGHELRNPLGAMLLALEMLERTDGDTSKYRGIVKRQAGNLSRMVDDLLDVSRVTSGKIVLQHVPIDVTELVRRCVQTLEAATAAQGLDVECHFDAQPFVSGDLVRLEQVVVNLVNNAIKYTPKGGHLSIRVGEQDGCALIEVRDDGVGITDEMLPRVFDLFTQVPGTLDRAKGGLGIGLTLVRSLVELHQGSVDATSQGLGKGSTFTVRLPVAAGLAPGRPSTISDHAMLRGDTRQILLVEDNPDSRDTMRDLLERIGHHVAVAGDGPEAVQRALEHRPQVCIIDIGLPGIDGYEVARRLRIRLGEHVYLIALTGYGQPEDRRRAFDAGFDSHFTKPVDVRSICKLLAKPDLLATG
jgi:signal transduction histidine kinase/ActR/RegA family two-component response regulator